MDTFRGRVQCTVSGRLDGIKTARGEVLDDEVVAST
jgi:hypothetical protein